MARLEVEISANVDRLKNALKNAFGEIRNVRLGGVQREGDTGITGSTGFQIIAFNQMVNLLGKITRILERASPALQGTFIMLQQAMTIFFRPFGEFLATMLRPIMIRLMKFAVKFEEYMRSLPEEKREAIMTAGMGGAVVGGIAGFGVGGPFGAMIGSILGGVIGTFGEILVTNMIDEAKKKVVKIWHFFDIDFEERVKLIWDFFTIRFDPFYKVIWDFLKIRFPVKWKIIWEFLKITFTQKIKDIWRFLKIIFSIKEFRVWDYLKLITKIITIDLSSILRFRLPRLPRFRLPWRRQVGGFIPETGVYMLHRGEEVIPAIRRRETRGGIFKQTVNINNPKISDKIDMEDISRRVNRETERILRRRGLA